MLCFVLASLFFPTFVILYSLLWEIQGSNNKMIFLEGLSNSDPNYYYSPTVFHVRPLSFPNAPHETLRIPIHCAYCYFFAHKPYIEEL